MQPDRQKLATEMRRLSVEVVVTPFGEFPCPPELSLRHETGVKLRNNQTPDRRTIKGREWYRNFNAFCDQRLKDYERERDQSA